MNKNLLLLPKIRQLFALSLAFTLLAAPITIPAYAETTAQPATANDTSAAKQAEPVEETDAKSVTMTKKDTTYIAKKTGQEFHYPDCPKSIFIVQAGTKLKPYGGREKTLFMPAGKFVVITGKEDDLELMTPFGEIDIPTATNAIVEYTPDGITRVQTLMGNSLTITFRVANHPFALTVDSGDEICVASDENANGKQLVLEDGVERQSLECAYIPGVKSVMNRIDPRTMCAKEQLLNSPDETPEAMAEIALLKKKAKPIRRGKP